MRGRSGRSRQVCRARIFQSVAAGLLGESSFERHGNGGARARSPLLHRDDDVVRVLHGRESRRPASPAAGAVRCRLWAGALRDHELHRGAALGGGRRSKDLLWVSLSILVHMFLIGLPITRRVARASDVTATAEWFAPSAYHDRASTS